MRDGHHRPTGPVIFAIAAVLCAGFLMAQPAPKASSQTGAPASNLNQLMRALFFPNSNVVFFTQRFDPAEVKAAAEPSTSTDPLTGVFGGWGAVEDSALTLADAADLLMTPGRKCSNGLDVPLANPDWAPLVNGLRASQYGRLQSGSNQRPGQDARRIRGAGYILRELP